MSLKSIVHELKEIRDGIGSKSRRGVEGKHWHCRKHTHIVPDQSSLLPSDSSQQSLWANLPPEFLLDIIRKVEDSETSWPAHAVVIFCASVCRTWREVTKEIVQTPEQCGRITFPISLKQPGPRESPIQCFIRKDKGTFTYHLCFGLMPSKDGSDKLLLAAKKIRRAICTGFVISLAANDFYRESNSYIGKLRSNFLGTKFITYDSQPPWEMTSQPTSGMSRKFHSKQQPDPPKPTVPSEMAAWAAASAANSPALCRALVRIKTEGLIPAKRGRSPGQSKPTAPDSLKAPPVPNNAELVIAAAMSNGVSVNQAEPKSDNPPKKSRACCGSFESNGMDVMRKMPSVRATGDSPNGRRV